MTQPPERQSGDTLRVVHVSCHRDREGRSPQELLAAWPTLLGVARGLTRAGVETTIVQAADEGQRLDVDGVKLHFVASGSLSRGGKRGASMVRASSQMMTRIAESQPHVIHVNGIEHPRAIRQIATRFAPTPVVVQDHASAPPRGWRVPLWRWATRPLTAAIFTHAAQAAPFVEAGAFDTSLPIHEVLEGSCSFTTGDIAHARRQTGLHGNPCLLWTGHLDDNKDPLTVLAAFELAAPRLNDARLWCCFGAAPLLDAVKQRIASSPVLRDRVTLLGRQPPAMMESYFRAADFFVQASHRESCGFSTIEALACGTAPLVTDIPSSRRIVGDAGSLTRVGDANALAEAIVDWSRRDRADVRRAARERFERELTFDAIGRELRSVYESVTGRA